MGQRSAFFWKVRSLLCSAPLCVPEIARLLKVPLCVPLTLLKTLGFIEAIGAYSTETLVLRVPWPPSFLIQSLLLVSRWVSVTLERMSLSVTRVIPFC